LAVVRMLVVFNGAGISRNTSGFNGTGSSKNSSGFHSWYWQ